MSVKRHFLSGLSEQGGFGLSPEATSKLGRYTYPGNVRQLENTIRRAATFARAQGRTAIGAGDIDFADWHDSPGDLSPTSQVDVDGRLEAIASGLAGFDRLEPGVQQAAMSFASVLRDAVAQPSRQAGDVQARRVASLSLTAGLSVDDHWPGLDALTYALAIALRWDLSERWSVEPSDVKDAHVKKYYGTTFGKGGERLDALRQRMRELVVSVRHEAYWQAK